MSGGGSRSGVWSKIAASVLDVPLERIDLEAGAAFGAALLGGVPAGVFADAAEAVAACIRVRERVEPGPGVDGTSTTENYERYRALYPALRPLEAT